jgi:hypothetical protein
MAVRIGVVFDRQHASLAVALRGLLPSADIVSFDLGHVIHDPAGRERIGGILRDCDHVISHDIPPGQGPLGTRLLSRTAKRFHLIPPLCFGGFHPDTVSVMVDHVPLESPIGTSHSRIVIAAYLAGLTPEQAGDLFNGLVYARLGYFDAAAAHATLLLEKFAAYGIDLSQALPQWMQTGCFMYGPAHPKLLVFLDLARAACRMMDIAPQAAPRVTMLPDPMAAFETLPFLPDIAARLGIRPEGTIRATLPARPLTLPEFIAGSYTAFKRAPLGPLRQAQGVSAAMAALGLAGAPRAQPQKPGTTCLLSYHGTMLRADLNSNLLLHEPVWPENPDSTDFTLTPVTGADGATTAAIMGGVDIVPGGMPGTISLRRQGAFVSVDPGRAAVPLNRAAANSWERFLPLTLADAAHLRQILSRNWLIEGGDALPAAAITIHPDFTLDLGGITVDLAAHRPAPLSDGPGFTVQTASGARTLRPDPAPHDPETALRPAARSAFAGDAGSLAGFRTSANGALAIDGGDEILHPPLTMCPADAAWVYDKWYYRPGMPPLGQARHEYRIQRAPDLTLLLGRGLEGVLINRAGVLKDHGFLTVNKKIALPPGLRLHGETMLMQDSMRQAARRIPGPSVVFYNPNLQNYYHWLVEAALPLRLMAPYLPADARLIMPGTLAAMAASGHAPLDHAGVLDAIGLGHLPRLDIEAPICRLADAIWPDNVSLAALPAAMLHRFRDEVAALYPAETGKRHRIYIERRRLREVAANPALAQFLAAQGFTSVVLEDLPPAAQIRLFLHAEMVVAPHGAGLANLLFCPPGTRVLEIAPDTEFRPFFWMIAEKLGFAYGVLPCPTRPAGYNGSLQVDVRRLRALYRMLRFFDH